MTTIGAPDRNGPRTDDENKVLQVAALCRRALPDAEFIKSGDRADTSFDQRSRRYGEQKQQALQVAETIAGEFHCAAALHRIVALCVAAGDIQQARVLFGKIRTPFVQEQIRRENADVDF